MASRNMVLSNKSGYCGQRKDLFRCSACKVMFYCSVDHQKAHHPAHKYACQDISQSSHEFEEHERQFGEIQLPDVSDPDMLPNFAGFDPLWVLPQIPDHMQTRYTLAQSLHYVRTYAAGEARLEHLMKLLHSARRDEMGVRAYVPGLMIRLGQDQNCYDFIKWWTLVNQNFDYDWNKREALYLNLKGEDVFEDVGFLCVGTTEHQHLAAVILLKIRMVLDLTTLHNINNETYGKNSNEMRLRIKTFALTSSIIADNLEILDTSDNSARVGALVAQVRILIEYTKKTCRGSWANLRLLEEDNFSRYLTDIAPVTDDPALSWAESPRAIEFIRRFFKRIADIGGFEANCARRLPGPVLFPY